MKNAIIFRVILFIGILGLSRVSAFRIGIIGDRTGGADAGVFDAVISEMALLRPDAVITVGDLIEGPQPNAEAIHREWDRVMQSLAPLTCPRFYVPGNNDIFDDTSRDLYTERTGAHLEYACDIGGVHFIFLDNSRMRNWDTMSDERMVWLEKTLADTHADSWTCVVFHKPFWLENAIAGIPDRLHPLLVKYGVDYVFSGHHHRYTAMETDGVQYVMIGSSGGHIGDNPYRGEFYHYGWLTVDADGLHPVIISPGNIHAQNWLTLADRMEQDAAETCFLNDIRTTLNTGDKTAVRFSFNSECGITGGAYVWDNSGTDWIISPDSGSFDLTGGPVSVHSAAWLRGSRYPAPRLIVTTELNQREYKFFRSLQTTLHRAIPAADQAPVIDGRASEDIWNKAVIVDGFGSETGGVCPTDPVSLRMVRHGGRLYVAIHAAGDRTEDQNAAETPLRDSPVFMQDCVYLMFWTNEKPARMSQIVLNDRGGILDQQGFRDEIAGERPRMDAAWNADITLETAGDSSKWTAEMAIRMADLGLKDGEPFYFNAFRYQPSRDAFSVWIAPATFDPADAGRME